MNSETRNCQNCKQNFTIEPDDFSFYEKISSAGWRIPPPTWCPECRMIRRLCWRNERSLFYRTCDFTGKRIVTMFHPEENIKVYDREIWGSDKWDPSEYGQDYDFSRPFFEQFRELLSKVPLANVGNMNCLNSPYGNHNADCKNCYLVYASYLNEDVMYSQGASELKNCLDIYSIMKSQNCYGDILSGTLYNTHFSYDTDGSVDSYFLKSCVNCNNCIGCMNLRSKKYCIFNEQYTKEEYEKLVPKIIKHMNDMPYIDKKGRVYKYGEFFPAELSPFSYNETIAQEYFPESRYKIEEMEYRYREQIKRDYRPTIKSENLPDHIKDTKESIVKEIISCPNNGSELTKCTVAYNIMPEELSFLKNHNIALPRYCPNCRHFQRLNQRKPMKLWHRKCMCDKTNHFHGAEKCQIEFETSYALERPEIIYCERCYQAEVY